MRISGSRTRPAAIDLAAVDTLQRNVALIPEELRYERFGQATSMASFSRSILSLALSDLGRFAEASQQAEESARIAEEAGLRYSMAFAWHALGVAHVGRATSRAGGSCSSGAWICAAPMGYR